MKLNRISINDQANLLNVAVFVIFNFLTRYQSETS